MLGISVALADEAAPEADQTSIAGTWKLTVKTPNGISNPILRVEATSSGYRAFLTGRRGTKAIESVKVVDDRFSFATDVTMPMGSFEMTYAGTVAGDTLRGEIGNMMGTIPFTGERKSD